MDHEQLSDKLYEKAADELEAYRSWLLRQSPEEILEHTFEYTAKTDIVLSLLDIDEDDLTAAQLTALLGSPHPLADIYKEFRDMDTGLMDTLLECAGDMADRLIETRQEREAQDQRKPSIRDRLSAKPVPGSRPSAKPRGREER